MFYGTCGRAPTGELRLLAACKRIWAAAVVSAGAAGACGGWWRDDTRHPRAGRPSPFRSTGGAEQGAHLDHLPALQAMVSRSGDHYNPFAGVLLCRRWTGNGREIGPHFGTSYLIFDRCLVGA